MLATQLAPKQVDLSTARRLKPTALTVQSCLRSMWGIERAHESTNARRHDFRAAGFSLRSKRTTFGARYVTGFL